MTIGIGIGVSHFPAGGAAGGGSSPTYPDALSDLALWVDALAGNITTSGDPAQVVTLTNQAAGGSALTRIGNAPYYWDADWAIDTPGTGPATVSAPGGNPFFGGEDDIDSTRVDETNIQFNVDTPNAAKPTGQSGYIIFYIHSGDNQDAYDRRLWEGQSGTGYITIDGTGVVRLIASGQTFQVRSSGGATEWCDAWNIYAWSRDAGTFSHSLNGQELAVEVDVSAGVSGFNLLYLWRTIVYNFLVASCAIWEADHGLAALNPVLSTAATQFGVDYTYAEL